VSTDGSSTGASATTAVDGSSTGASGAGSSTTGADPATYHLQHGDQSACDLPLWCYWNGMIDTPAGDPIEGQECFVAPIAPPFELIAMHYVVAETHTDLEQFELRIYERDASGPTQLIESVPLTSVEAAPIEHYFDFETPIQIDAQEFCVGFAATDPGLASALGMAVDTDSLVEDAAFFRMEGNGGCDIPDWQDVVTYQPNPFGNWCMDATIRELP
jgi:hypothetical protein